MILSVVALGIGAGLVSTLAGQGGGLFLILACSALLGPHAALAATTPALFLGNVHRAALFRHAIAWPIAKRVIVGALPGALVGGFLAGWMPRVVITTLLGLLTALALVKALFKLRFAVPERSLAPSGFVIGTMTGAAGGAGFLVAPLLLASGLTGRAFASTTSTIAVAMHAGRIVAYGSTGLLGRDLLPVTAALALAIAGGNLLGERIRRLVPERASSVLEYGVLVVCGSLAFFGIA
jgi:uncharacterized membrane protein YfcA